jgi:hypothetical protein
LPGPIHCNDADVPDCVAETTSTGKDVRVDYDIQCSSRNRRSALVAQHRGVCNGAPVEFRPEPVLGGHHFVRCGTDNRIFGDDAISHRCLGDRKRPVTVAL